MAIYHMHIKMISSKSGRSAIAAAAYRSASVIKSERTGVTSDYKNKAWQIVHSEVDLPSHVPSQYKDRATLWNAVEAIEHNSNAQYAREVEIALPSEWSHDLQIKVMHDFIRSTFVDEGMCADWSIHDKKDGNPHCHIMLTTRPIDKDGNWETKEKKIYKLDENGEKIPVIDPSTGLQKIGARGRKMWMRETVKVNPWNSKELAKKWRKDWETTANKYLEQDHQISAESYKTLGIDKMPTIHEGPTAKAMEEDGKSADRCKINRTIKEQNHLLESIKTQLKENLTVIKAYISGLRQKVDKCFDYLEDGLERAKKAVLERSLQKQQDQTFKNDDLSAFNAIKINKVSVIRSKDHYEIKIPGINGYYSYPLEMIDLPIESNAIKKLDSGDYEVDITELSSSRIKVRVLELYSNGLYSTNSKEMTIDEIKRRFDAHNAIISERLTKATKQDDYITIEVPTIALSSHNDKEYLTLPVINGGNSAYYKVELNKDQVIYGDDIKSKIKVKKNPIYDCKFYDYDRGKKYVYDERVNLSNYIESFNNIIYGLEEKKSEGYEIGFDLREFNQMADGVYENEHNNDMWYGVIR